MKKQESFVSSTGLKEFTRIGTGISVFSENMSLAASSGASAAFSYHIPLNSRNLSFLSVGASAKAYRHSFDGDTSLGLKLPGSQIPVPMQASITIHPGSMPVFQ